MLFRIRVDEQLICVLDFESSDKEFPVESVVV